MRWVRLYYPNRWRRNIGDLADPADKTFNWFLCSKRYKDPETGLYVAEIASGTKFYEEESGHTFVVPLEPKIKVLIDESVSDLERVAKEKGYQGIALMGQCNLSNPDAFFICHDVKFGFFEDSIVISKKERFCDIIDYSKRHSKCIQRVIPDFPTAEEIDGAVEKNKCSVMCKVLHQYVLEYTEAQK